MRNRNKGETPILTRRLEKGGVDRRGECFCPEERGFTAASWTGELWNLLA